MPAITQQITKNIPHLPLSEREALVQNLIYSQDDRWEYKSDEQNDSDRDILWMKEIERRSDEVKNNRVNCRPLSDVVSNIRKKLKNAHSQSS